MINISHVDVRDAEPLVLDVLRSGQLTQGRMVERLESGFTEIAQTRHVVAVNNGTTALIVALQALEPRPGDEVIIPPFTFVATLNAALAAGFTVRFADIDDHFLLDLELVSNQINQRTLAVMPVHLYGQCVDFAQLKELQKNHGLRIVEDAAQAHGALSHGRAAGSIDIGCFSLYATKNLTAGEGGLISTDSDAIAEKIRVLRNQGMRNRYEYLMIGNNYRLSDLHAALTIPQLSRTSDVIKKRQENASKLISGLKSLDSLTLPSEKVGHRHVWHQFTVTLNEQGRITREQFIQRMASNGVGCGIYYPRLVHDYDCFKNHPQVIVSETPNARRLASSCVSLPVHQHLTDSEIDHIVEACHLSLS